MAARMPKFSVKSEGLTFLSCLHICRISKIAFDSDGAVLVESRVGFRMVSRFFLKLAFESLSWHVRTCDVFSSSLLQRGQREWFCHFLIFNTWPTPMQPEACLDNHRFCP
ncbi:hypothetical protein FRACYDRAFT_268124 [Fragilariopsis cylindrus CCMP1102]|uniref:Uncharacterized protein n=1 Tax=Fragilariopsis cylindrus CCMP1102 TaxID=635003 RepID=A0A1E7FLE9_9STRA|nr:hypothetical protein FRACYDRAFT_268521 [Fragilariopsis cylindrus CCMP1102]OEU19919.1 hypothetical protein FRACYDRAFT_268124 [Fragilariopsis cylindrus CCMP1102]|eukprot:OEU18991.1 hypothetical protein FRACYDRAFT_268521 [Fragilariopsis cylindrus CCMP1102]